MREIGIFVPSSLRIHVILLALMLHNFVGLASTAFPVPWCVGPVGQYAGEKPATDLEIRVYPGVDGDFTLYADEGANYYYEKGMRSTIRVHWNDAKRELTIGQRNGQFFGMLQSKQFKIVAVDASSVRQVRYDGKKVARIQQLQLHRNGDNPVLLDTVYAKSTAALDGRTLAMKPKCQYVLHLICNSPQVAFYKWSRQQA